MIGRAARATALAVAGLGASTGLASAQGVPIIDGNLLKQNLAILAEQERDLGRQQGRLDRSVALLQIDAEIIAELDKLIEAGDPPVGATGDMIQTLEDGAGQPAASADNLYNPDDTNPAADKTFGDAALTVEEVIIAGSKATYGHAGVSKAGLSQAQWRALIQAMIWQESRFNPHAESPVGAYGLTQIMPDTAGDLGIRSTYRSDPYIQAEGGARYLAQQLNAFDGDMILALAAYNAGAGNVRKHGGVPPFAETQKYVQVIPAKYREYMAKLGAADQIGSIEASYLANAEKAMIGGAVAQYADEAGQDMGLAMARLEEAMSRLDQTENAAEAMALNSFVRAEFARLLVIRTRLIATRSKPLSAEAVAAAAAFAQERRFMDFQGRL